MNKVTAGDVSNQNKPGRLETKNIKKRVCLIIGVYQKKKNTTLIGQIKFEGTPFPDKPTYSQPSANATSCLHTELYWLIGIPILDYNYLQ